MQRAGLFRALCCFLFTCCVSGVSLAAPVRVDFSGFLTFVNDPDLIFDDSIAPGTPFSGYFLYDSEGRDISTTPGASDYLFDGEYGGNFTLGSYHVVPLSGVSSFVAIYNDYPNGEDQVQMSANQDYIGLNPDAKPIYQPNLSLFLRDGSGKTITSTALTPSLFDLSRWPENSFAFSAFGTPDQQSLSTVFGRLTSMSAQTVPAPDSLALFAGLSLPGLACLRRRRRAS